MTGRRWSAGVTSMDGWSVVDGKGDREAHHRHRGGQDRVQLVRGSETSSAGGRRRSRSHSTPKATAITPSP
jgi:hypothetical protein